MIQEILKKFTDLGYEAYVVGGYPRELYLNLDKTDIDICTNCKKIEKIFPKSHYNKYLSCKINYKNHIIQITSYRKDIKYYKNRFPKVKYTKKLKTDLKRRDFTINTLCLDQNNKIIDLLKIKKDFDLKIIKTVGNSDKKIKEDALRILRAIRFSTTLNFSLDKKLEKSILKYKKNLNQLSYDRKKEELDKIFKSANVKKGIELIQKLQIDKYLKINFDKIKITSNYLGIWAQTNTLNIYNFTKEEKNIINKINELSNKKLTDLNLYKYGLNIALIVAEIKNQNIEKQYEKLPIHKKEDIKINKKELEKYKNINEIYKDLEEKIITKKLKNEEKILKKYLQNNYK